MNWNSLLTYGDSPQDAFEAFCNQLFEQYLKRRFNNDVVRYRVINGAGGDGGVEAYGQLQNGDIIVAQAKWFRQSMGDVQIKQIKNSILTAIQLRPQIKEYIICIPHNVHSSKKGKDGRKTISEEDRINKLEDEIRKIYPTLKLVWWFDSVLLNELQKCNDGIHSFWFDKEILSLDYLKSVFDLQKSSWLHKRYIAELHGQGTIHDEYHTLCFSIEYRNKLINEINKTLDDIYECIYHIDSFLPTNQGTPDINQELKKIKDNLLFYINEIEKIKEAFIVADDLYKPSTIKETSIYPTINTLQKLRPNNLQKKKLPQLISTLDNIHKHNLPLYVNSFANNFRQSIRLILGYLGTGKTHGLANCVELHLKQNSPAIIIHAKHCPCNSWTDILSYALNINGRNYDMILSALEALAIKNDVSEAKIGEDTVKIKRGKTKILICIDGLEEDIDKAATWAERIRESERIAAKYSRVCFMFSARKYFCYDIEIPNYENYDEIHLQREGDTQIFEISDSYFKHYNITLSSPSLIRGLDNLLALRLFCEEYEGKTLNESDHVITASKDLLNYKIERANSEFKSRVSIRNHDPINDALEIVSNYFYSNINIEHNELLRLLSSMQYLNSGHLDLLIEYLENNGFFIKTELNDNSTIPTNKQRLYYITYQSILENVLSESIYRKIKAGDITKIPEILHHGMIRPLDSKPVDFMYESFAGTPNQQITQNIIERIFFETGRLIGDSGFLIDGFEEERMFILRMRALSKAPEELALKYKKEVDEMFFGEYKSQYLIIRHLVFPSAEYTGGYYGAKYLHNILISQQSVFERDKLWSGYDSYERSKIDNLSYGYQSTISVFYNEIGKVYLSSDHKYDELPLLYAWGLSSISQELRSELRIALTGWAIKNPIDFSLLLDEIFHPCKDPQIQEDLASIALGVASKIKDERVKQLAAWSIQNIFSQLEIYRNTIVRQGFRAIVEKAFQLGLITEEDVKKCRPNRMQNILLLPLDASVIKNPKQEIYPIVHDLAWYVIKNAYSNFLEYPLLSGGVLKDNNTDNAKSLLEKYSYQYGLKGVMGPSTWALAAAISYIKELGLTRTSENGNHITDASHGSKSEVFTYEEKYTWLAVHYLQGYLSDYVPFKNDEGEYEFVNDYAQLTNIPNPADNVFDFYELNELSPKKFMSKNWVIKEPLSKEIMDADIQRSIKSWVDEEPSLNFENWIKFNSIDFEKEDSRSWLALYNHTSLLDSQEYGFTSIDVTACLIDTQPIEYLLEHLSDKDSYLVHHAGKLHASPQTDIYCNPSDIVWMPWIGESGSEMVYSNKVKLYSSIIEITQDTVKGESYLTLPSKRIRKLLDCSEYKNKKLIDSNQNVVALIHKLSEGYMKDSQEIVAVDLNKLQAQLDNEKLSIIWFVTLFKEKNPLNESIKAIPHVQRARKYLVWMEEETFCNHEFWNERFTNARDIDASIQQNP